MQTPPNGFMKDDYLFSGWIMLRLRPKEYDWRDWLVNICQENKDNIINAEFDCHVTLAGGIHRDDVIRYYKNDAFPLDIGGFVVAENHVSYFDNESSVAKFAIKDPVSVANLWEFRNQIFAQCRCLEHYPNFQPHITVAYLKKGKRLKETSNVVPFAHEFFIDSISFSITQNNGEPIEW